MSWNWSSGRLESTWAKPSHEPTRQENRYTNPALARSAAQLTVALVLQAIRKERDNTGLKMQINALEGQLAAANSRAEDSAKVW